MRRTLRFRVAPELLREALKIPATCEIYGATWDGVTESLELIVTDPSFPALPAGAAAPLVTPTLTKVTEVSTDWDWNLPGPRQKQPCDHRHVRATFAPVGIVDVHERVRVTVTCESCDAVLGYKLAYRQPDGRIVAEVDVDMGRMR